jgi:hypothetical protein
MASLKFNQISFANATDSQIASAVDALIAEVSAQPIEAVLA